MKKKKEEEAKIEEANKKKKEREDILKKIRQINEQIIKHKLITFDESKITMEQVTSFTLNVLPK